MSDKKRIPIEAGLFTLPSEPGEKSRLIGSRCKACGEIFFPAQVRCARCIREEMEEIFLSTKGEVYSSTSVWVRPPLYEGPLPYAIGQVKLPEGVIVPAVFTDCSFEKPLPIGTNVEMVLEKFSEDEQGNEIMTYKFRPVRESSK